MKPLLLALLLCAACKHSTSSSSTSHSETSTVTDSTSTESGSQTTVTTTSEAPSKTTTVVEEYAPPVEGESQGPDAGQEPSGVPAQDLPASPSESRNVPRRGALVKRTVTTTERGAETTETHQQASTQAQGATQTKRNTEGDTKTKGKSASGPSAGCIGASWLWGAAILAGVIGVLYFAVKMRKSV